MAHDTTRPAAPEEAAAVPGAIPAPAPEPGSIANGQDSHPEASQALELSAPRAPRFEDMGLEQEVLQALTDMGYTQPTPVQAAVFEHAAAGRDIMVQSRTGTGKTAAFGIPIVHKLSAAQPGAQVLALAPTRELALQVAREIQRIAEHKRLHVVPIYGGAPMKKQIDALAEGAQIIAGTPGRVLDHIGRGTLRTDNIRLLVLDECDEMLSMGFQEEIEKILETLPPRDQRQTLLFSATIPESIQRIARRHMREPMTISLSTGGISVDEIEHYYYLVSGMARTRDLLKIMKAERPESAIVFCNTREDTGTVAKFLTRHGYQAEAISSDLTQREREQVMRQMRERTLPFLVATDVAARGIDISNLSHVINYTFPESPEVYVHRTGRTGRAGQRGIAISLVGPREIGAFYYLKLIYKIQPQERDMPSAEELATLQEGERYEEVVRRVTGEPRDEYLSLARRLWQSTEGERVIGMLLERLLTGDAGQKPSRVAESGPRAAVAPGEAPEHLRGDDWPERLRGEDRGEEREVGEERRSRGRDERGRRHRDDRPGRGPRRDRDTLELRRRGDTEPGRERGDSERDRRGPGLRGRRDERLPGAEPGTMPAEVLTSGRDEGDEAPEGRRPRREFQSRRDRTGDAGDEFAPRRDRGERRGPPGEPGEDQPRRQRMRDDRDRDAGDEFAPRRDRGERRGPPGEPGEDQPRRQRMRDDRDRDAGDEFAPRRDRGERRGPPGEPGEDQPRRQRMGDEDRDAGGADAGADERRPTAAEGERDLGRGDDRPARRGVLDARGSRSPRRDRVRDERATAMPAAPAGDTADGTSAGAEEHAGGDDRSPRRSPLDARGNRPPRRDRGREERTGGTDDATAARGRAAHDGGEEARPGDAELDSRDRPARRDERRSLQGERGERLRDESARDREIDRGAAEPRGAREPRGGRDERAGGEARRERPRAETDQRGQRAVGGGPTRPALEEEEPRRGRDERGRDERGRDERGRDERGRPELRRDRSSEAADRAGDALRSESEPEGRSELATESRRNGRSGEHAADRRRGAAVPAGAEASAGEAESPEGSEAGRRSRRRRGEREERRERPARSSAPEPEFWEAWADEKSSRQAQQPLAPRSQSPRSQSLRAISTPADDADSGEFEVAGDTTRLFVNLGKREDVTAEEVRSLLGEALGSEAERIGRVAMRNTHCYVRVPSDLVDRVIRSTHGKQYRDRELVVERARR
jgi:ATP-dependent RNA helicase DeaD